MNNYHNQNISYRPEIDGLRAVAVLPVILFHAGIAFFSGGYVGVDVFFVISGYLITSILLREMEQDKFSLVNFYERRARRILPALFFVIACCLPFAWLWMLPQQLKAFGQSLVAVSLFSSNIFFWLKTDYFSPAAEELPLLHTWSLAVEEQYYFLFPLFLFFFWRFGKSRLFWMTVAIAVTSLLLSEWAWRNYSAANFYILPTRAWELLVGSLLAFLPAIKAEQLRQSRYSQVASVVGLGLIVYSIVSFDKTTPFPSVYALLPVGGAALIIVFASPSNFVGWLLSKKAFVGVGLSSYSAYLWHQPLFAFLRIYPLSYPGQAAFVACSGFALILAILTWKYIEIPIRSSRSLKVKPLFLGFSGVMVMCTLGLLVHQLDGKLWRYPAEIISRLDKAEDPEILHCMKTGFWAKECDLGSKEDIVQVNGRLALIGDSHAGHIAEPLSQFMKQHNWSGRFFNKGGCPPINSLNRRDVSSEHLCAKHVDSVLHAIEGYDLVMLSARWQVYFDGRFDNGLGGQELGSPVEFTVAGKEYDGSKESMDLVAENFAVSIKTLLKKNKQVVLLHGLPEWGWQPDDHFVKSWRIEGAGRYPELPRFTIESRLKNANKIINHSISLLNENERSRVKVISQIDLFCNRSICVSYNESGSVLWRDDDHLNNLGADVVINKSIFSLIAFP